MKENAVEEWRLWKEIHTDYAIITKVDKESKEFQRAVFLNAAGPLARYLVHPRFEVHLISMEQTNNTVCPEKMG